MTIGKNFNSVKSYQLAGMMDSSKRVEALIQARQYDAPQEVRTDGRRLLWRANEDLELAYVWDYMPGRKQQDSQLLFKFTKLADAAPSEILRFALRWGVLGICKHGVPYTHIPPPAWATKTRYWCLPLRARGGEFWEPIETWHRYARQARAMLNVAANLHQDRPGDPDDWNVLFEPHSDGKGNDRGRHLGNDKFMLTFLVNHWLEMGNVRPKFQWYEESITVSYDTPLFGVIASQLLLVVSRTRGLGICSGCGETFIPRSRRPKTAQRNYCGSCGKRAAWRDAQAAYRRRRREAKSGEMN